MKETKHVWTSGLETFFSTHPEQRYPPQLFCGAAGKTEAAIRLEQLASDLGTYKKTCFLGPSAQNPQPSIRRTGFAREARNGKDVWARYGRRADPARGYSRIGAGISAFKVSTNFDKPSCLLMTASNPVDASS